VLESVVTVCDDVKKWKRHAHVSVNTWFKTRVVQTRRVVFKTTTVLALTTLSCVPTTRSSPPSQALSSLPSSSDDAYIVRSPQSINRPANR
jgi:hypothetical protein